MRPLLLVLAIVVLMFGGIVLLAFTVPSGPSCEDRGGVLVPMMVGKVMTFYCVGADS